MGLLLCLNYKSDLSQLTKYYIQINIYIYIYNYITLFVQFNYKLGEEEAANQQFNQRIMSEGASEQEDNSDQRTETEVSLNRRVTHSSTEQPILMEEPPQVGGGVFGGWGIGKRKASDGSFVQCRWCDMGGNQDAVDFHEELCSMRPAMYEADPENPHVAPIEIEEPEVVFLEEKPTLDKPEMFDECTQTSKKLNPPIGGLGDTRKSLFYHCEFPKCEDSAIQYTFEEILDHIYGKHNKRRFRLFFYLFWILLVITVALLIFMIIYLRFRSTEGSSKNCDIDIMIKYVGQEEDLKYLNSTNTMKKKHMMYEMTREAYIRRMSQQTMSNISRMSQRMLDFKDSLKQIKILFNSLLMNFQRVPPTKRLACFGKEELNEKFFLEKIRGLQAMLEKKCLILHEEELNKIQYLEFIRRLNATCYKPPQICDGSTCVELRLLQECTGQMEHLKQVTMITKYEMLERENIKQLKFRDLRIFQDLYVDGTTQSKNNQEVLMSALIANEKLRTDRILSYQRIIENLKQQLNLLNDAKNPQFYSYILSYPDLFTQIKNNLETESLEHTNTKLKQYIYQETYQNWALHARNELDSLEELSLANNIKSSQIITAFQQAKNNSKIANLDSWSMYHSLASELELSKRSNDQLKENLISCNWTNFKECTTLPGWITIKHQNISLTEYKIYDENNTDAIKEYGERDLYTETQNTSNIHKPGEMNANYRYLSAGTYVSIYDMNYKATASKRVELLKRYYPDSITRKCLILHTQIEGICCQRSGTIDKYNLYTFETEVIMDIGQNISTCLLTRDQNLLVGTYNFTPSSPNFTITAHIFLYNISNKENLLNYTISNFSLPTIMDERSEIEGNSARQIAEVRENIFVIIEESNSYILDLNDIENIKYETMDPDKLFPKKQGSFPMRYKGVVPLSSGEGDFAMAVDFWKPSAYRLFNLQLDLSIKNNLSIDDAEETEREQEYSYTDPHYGLPYDIAFEEIRDGTVIYSVSFSDVGPKHQEGRHYIYDYLTCRYNRHYKALASSNEQFVDLVKIP